MRNRLERRRLTLRAAALCIVLVLLCGCLLPAFAEGPERTDSVPDQTWDEEIEDEPAWDEEEDIRTDEPVLLPAEGGIPAVVDGLDDIGLPDETPTPDPDLATEEELKQLEDAIAKAEAEKLNQDDYTADSWTAYANALAQAKKVLAKENATSTEVQDAIRHLTEARKALVKVSADGKKPGPVISDTGAAVFGVAGTVVVLAAAGIALTIWRKRRI